MSKAEYKRLGDYIRPVDVRNRGLKVHLSQGICNAKYFQNPKQVADNPETHKVVRTGQFAYNRATTRNGEKISIALREGPDCTVSSAYQVFEVVDENLLNPKYLMMWFKRPEFDRLAIYYSHGSAHEFFEWEAMCDVMLPIPSITRQREIVSEYETLTNRIRLNNQMIQHLEATAQALYRKTFVDNIDKENLPEGWRMGTLGDLCIINTDNISSKDSYKEIDYLDSSSVTENQFDAYQHLIVGKDEIPSRAKRKVRTDDIVYSTVRPNLKHYGIIKGDVSNVVVSTAFAVIRSNTPTITNELLYLILTDDAITEMLQGIAEMSKATYPSISPENIMELKVTLPQQMDNSFSELNWSLKKIFDNIAIIHKENKKLTELQSLLLAKMGQ